MNINNKIIVLCGKSASGKDTIANLLKEEGYNFVISHSTRPMRDGESEGNPYYFVSKEEIFKMLESHQLIELREYKTILNNINDIWYYAVHKNAIKKNEKYVVVLDLKGLEDFKEHFGDRIESFFIDCDDDIRKERAEKRGGFDITEWNRRLKTDKEDFKEYFGLVDNIFHSDEHSAEKIKSFILTTIKEKNENK